MSAMRLDLKVSSHARKLNMKSSLTGWKLQVLKRQVLGDGISDLWVEQVEEEGRSLWLEVSGRQLEEAPWEASQGE